MNLNQPTPQQLGNYPAFPTTSVPGIAAHPDFRDPGEISRRAHGTADAILLQQHVEQNPSTRSPGTGSPEYTA